ncbi:MAG: hypothetical protein JSU07_09775 [Bacteroidetes bacterium]|nr:hypothetical protein [Bacteroidota bacterium]
MKPRNTKEESLKIPMDILLDVLTIIVKENVRHEVTDVLESRGIAKVSLYLNNDLLKHQRVLNNIQNIIEEYNEYRYSDNEEPSWRD